MFGHTWHQVYVNGVYVIDMTSAIIQNGPVQKDLSNRSKMLNDYTWQYEE